MKQSRTTYIIGSGGHSRVIARAIEECGRDWCYISDGAEPVEQSIQEEDFFSLETEQIGGLICGIGSIGSMHTRSRVLEKYSRFYQFFSSIIHPHSSIDSSSSLEKGTFVARGAVIGCFSKIGRHCIINTGAIVDHDCSLGASCHIAPGAVLSGGVVCHDGCHVGVGATVMQGVVLAPNTVIGAGVVVRKSIQEPGGVWVGAPLRRIG